MELPHDKAKNKRKKANCFEGTNLTVANLKVVSIIAVSSFAERFKHLLTFEVSWHQRQDARPEPQKMYTVPVTRAWWPAVGAQLDRGVRRHLALPVLCCSDELPKALAPDNNSAVLGWFDAARNGDHEILEGLYVAYSNHLLLQAVEV